MSRWPFHFATVADDPEEKLPDLERVFRRIDRHWNSEPVLNDESVLAGIDEIPLRLKTPTRHGTAVSARRERVQHLVCRKGHVCSGTFACPCKAEDHRPAWWLVSE